MCNHDYNHFRNRIIGDMYLHTFDEEFAQLCTFEGPPSTRLENSVAPESALVSSVQAYSHVP